MSEAMKQDTMGRRVLRFPIVERGWRVVLFYAVTIGLLYVSFRWLERKPDGMRRELLTVSAVVAMGLSWYFIGGASLELLPEAVLVRRSGFLARPERLSYSTIARVDMIDDDGGYRLIVAVDDGTTIELGPWDELASLVYRRRIMAAKQELEARVARARAS